MADRPRAPLRGRRGPRHLLGRLLAVEERGGLVEGAPPLSLREVLTRFGPEIRPFRGRLLAILALIALGTAIDAAVIALYGLVVDRVLLPGDVGALWPIAGAYVGLTLLGSLVTFGDDWISALTASRFVLELRCRVFSHLQGLDLAFFEQRRLGDLLSRLSGDVAAIETLVVSGLTDLVHNALRLVVFAVALVVIDPQLALVAFTVGPPTVFLARRLARLTRTAAREKRRRTGSVGAVAEEALGNVALVQAHGAEGHELARLRAEGEAALRADLAAVRIKGVFAPLTQLLELAGVLAVVAFGAWRLGQGAISVGALLAFMTYLASTYGPLRSLAKLSSRIFAACAGAERLVEILDAEPAVTSRAGARRLPTARGAVRFEAVRFTYPGAAAPALHGIDVAVPVGGHLAIVGASGAGKSTLGRLLLRFADPDAGAVRLDGHDLRDLWLPDLRARVAVVLQETLLVDGTVHENIAYGRPDIAEEQVIAAARAAGAHEFIAALPDGYAARVGQRGRRLSGGQRQRLAIARALVRDAPVLLLDEPTTGLDAHAAAQLRDPLARLAAGRTTITITHDLLGARHADRILVLEHGRVVEDGEHTDLLARGDAYAALWERQLGAGLPA